jgi:hypothetical protein
MDESKDRSQSEDRKNRQRSDQPLKRVNDDAEDEKEPARDRQKPQEKQSESGDEPPYPTGRKPIPG